MEEVVNRVSLLAEIKVARLVMQKQATHPSHKLAARPTPFDLTERWFLRWDMTVPEGVQIALCDDVLTTGAHLVTAYSMVRRKFPANPIIGCFLARRRLGVGAESSKGIGTAATNV